MVADAVTFLLLLQEMKAIEITTALIQNKIFLFMPIVFLST
jgi:hypothetical protein